MMPRPTYEVGIGADFAPAINLAYRSAPSLPMCTTPDSTRSGVSSVAAAAATRLPGPAWVGPPRPWPEPAAPRLSRPMGIAVTCSTAEHRCGRSLQTAIGAGMRSPPSNASRKCPTLALLPAPNPDSPQQNAIAPPSKSKALTAIRPEKEGPGTDARPLLEARLLESPLGLVMTDWSPTR